MTTHDSSIRRIGAAKFKANCLALLDDLTADGVIITKHGKPVARLVPYAVESSQLIGCLADKIELHGDLESTGLSWNVAEP